MAQLGKYEMVGFQHWQGMTKENHLGAIFQKQPEKASNLMVQLLAYQRGKSYLSYLSQFPVKEFDTDNEYTWDVIGSSYRNIPIIEARDENGNVVDSGMLGVGGTPFYVLFTEDWFADGNVIVGEKNEVYPLRIKGPARMEGTNALYLVELMGGVLSGMPAEELSYGKRFSIEYSPVEKELSREVGDVRFSSSVAMRNEWSVIRIKHKVTGNMLNDKLRVGIPCITNDGKRVVSERWMHHVEYKVEETFSDEKNKVIMFGRSNRNKNGEYLNFGKSGNVIKMGSGLREQMSFGNQRYYTKFSLKLLEDQLYELSSSKLEMGDRIFILQTGERGAIQFHKAVKELTSGWTQFVIDNASTNVIKKTNSPLHDNALSAGFQFTEYRAPNGVVIKIDVNPMYDDPIRNKILHPEGGVAESYRYDLLYIGTMDQPNIQLARVKGQSELRGYQFGFSNPFTGQTNNMFMSYDEDSAVIHRKWTGGVFILDPTRTMSLIPAILQ